MRVNITWQAAGVILAILVSLSSGVAAFVTIQADVDALKASVARIDTNVQWLLEEAVREGWAPPVPPPASPK